jgi:hypothetical protein
VSKLFKTIHYRPAEIAGFIAFVGVIVVQRIIRPNLTSASEELRFILGILPNFFAGIGMAIAIFVYQFSFFSRLGFSLEKTNLASGALSFLGLWIWEYAQTFTNKPFDWVDVAVSAVGAIISIAILHLLIQRNKKSGILHL